MDEKRKAPGVKEIQAPIKEIKIQRAVQPDASRSEIEGSHSSCVDHLCGCKR